METNLPTNKGGNRDEQRTYSGVQLYVEEKGKKENNGLFQKQNQKGG